jgi:hypothetical protein
VKTPAVNLKALAQASPDPSAPPRWLLLFHQIPPKPAYVRVKIWRRLQALGAVSVKNAVYALPRNEQTFEDLQWVLRELVAQRGTGSVCEARFVDGLTDEEIEALFVAARDADYDEIAADARKLAKKLSAASRAKWPTGVDAQVARLEKRLGDTIAIDFCSARGREAAEGLVVDLGRRIASRSSVQAARALSLGQRAAPVRGRTWVTRTGVHVDRIASAWLIRRFIDPEAKFKFVPSKGYVAEAGEIRFDMFEAEFTHEGDLVTFEVLLVRHRIDDEPLHAIAEIVHDIDLKESKFGRADTPGIQRVINGICMATRDDDTRIAMGSSVCDALYAYFRSSRSGTEPVTGPLKQKKKKPTRRRP